MIMSIRINEVPTAESFDKYLDNHSTQKNAVYNFTLLERGKNLLYVGDYS
jgi:hypothetical protein